MPNDACVARDGAFEPMYMIDFLISKSNIIIKNIKFIEKWGFLEKDIDFDYWFSTSIPHFSLFLFFLLDVHVVYFQNVFDSGFKYVNKV